MTMELYWIWLTLIKGIGPVNAKKLIDRFKTPEKIYGSGKEELSEAGINASIIEMIEKSRSLTEAKKVMDRCIKDNIKIITLDNELYPLDVKKHINTPVLIYYKGTLIKNSMGIGIVGSRRCSEYGKRVSVEAAEYLAENKIPVISGMSKGIDSYSHTACVQRGGYTIAILGSSVDICYPKENIKLMEKIIENGAVLSQFPPTTKPSEYNFPKRNYLISAWSRKLLIVEATEKSGALITANIAIEQGKETWAVPGNIFRRECAGTNRLIAKGCNMYLYPAQLDFGDTQKRESSLKEINKNDEDDLEQMIIDIIKHKPKTAEEIALNIKAAKENIIEVISTMEVNGRIKTIAGGRIELTP